MFGILLSQSKDGAASLLRMWHTIPDHRAENLTKITGISVASFPAEDVPPGEKRFFGGIKKSGYDRETAHEFVNRKIVHARLLGVSWTDSRWKLPRMDVIGWGASKITRSRSLDIGRILS